MSDFRQTFISNIRVVDRVFRSLKWATNGGDSSYVGKYVNSLNAFLLPIGYHVSVFGKRMIVLQEIQQDWSSIPFWRTSSEMFSAYTNMRIARAGNWCFTVKSITDFSGRVYFNPVPGYFYNEGDLWHLKLDTLRGLLKKAELEDDTVDVR